MSKKQIILVYETNEIEENVQVIFCTTSIRKLRNFIISKINKGDIYYGSHLFDKKQQVEDFKKDFINKKRYDINTNLFGIYYDYIYDGEEF